MSNVSLSGTIERPARRGRDDAGGRGTTAFVRAADVLLALLAMGGDGRVSHIARRTGISKAVVHRVLQSFCSRDLVEYDPATRGYRLGIAAAALGSRALAQVDLRALAMPVLRELMEQTGETATVSALVGDACVCLDQVVSAREVHMVVETGRPRPLRLGASSRAILAALPDAERERILRNELPEHAPATTMDRLRLAESLEQSRRRGATVSFGERQPEAAAIAAPVYRIDGVVTGAVSVCGPRDRFTPEAVERWVPVVRAAADRLTEALSRPAAFRPTERGA